jgi:prevent-host-death family protein
MPRRPEQPRTKRSAPAISASEFKATCLELMDDVARTGVDVIVTKHGRPVVRVSPVNEQSQSPWKFLANSVVRHGDIISPDGGNWSVSPTEPLTQRRPRTRQPR